MNMQTVRDACQLQTNALSIKLSDQIEQLDELITAEGDGAQFFEKTYITQGMQDLISEGMARLAGVSTHCMTGPWILATARCCCALSRWRPAWRPRSSSASLPGVKRGSRLTT